jgi:hypothetical protein
MKKFFCIFLILVVAIVVNAQQNSTDVNTIIKQTCAEAKKENKKAFIIFHASWCVWCHKLDSSMNDVSCKKYFTDNYVIAHVTTFEVDDKAKLNTPGAEQFLTLHHAKDQGIPAWFIFDADGNLLADSQLRPDGASLNIEGSNVGCPSNETEINYFISVLKKTSALSDAEKNSIQKRFARNLIPHQ